MRQPILAYAPADGIQQLVHSAPLVLPAKKSQERGRSYAINEAQKAHPQRISWLLVAFLNTTLYYITVLGC